MTPDATAGHDDGADQVDRDEQAAGQTKPASVVAQEAAPTTAEVAKSDVGQPDETRAEVVDVRQGMFGVNGSGDTSGYGGLVRPVVFAAPATRPLDGW
jgi:NADH-quinone oxidoreductase subunit C